MRMIIMVMVTSKHQITLFLILVNALTSTEKRQALETENPTCLRGGSSIVQVGAGGGGGGGERFYLKYRRRSLI